MKEVEDKLPKVVDIKLCIPKKGNKKMALGSESIQKRVKFS
jgi:hypothetical protein